MANIDTYLENIMQARYGRDVRQSIHDGIEAINEDAENAVDIATQAKGEAKTAQDSAQAYANQALAHEQQAQIYRNQAEQFKDEAFSGTPEGYEDVVAKVNSLKEHTDTYLAEVGTSEGSALARTIYGMSVQDGTPTPTSPVDIVSAKADFRCTGKNLISYPYYDTSKTVNGITFTDNGDGTITANGTATGLSRFAIKVGNLDNVKDGERVTLSGCPSGGGSNIYALYTQTVNNYDYGNGQEFNWSDNITGIAIVIFSGINVNNLVFKPMLTLEDADQTYEPYQHTDVTTDLTLRAIEVTSNIEHNLERDGKYYVADTVDWSEDEGYQITRRVGTFELDDNVNGFGINGSDTNRRFVLQYVNSLNIGVSKYNAVSMSDRFILETTNSSTWGHYRIDSDGYLILHDNASAMADVDTLKTWLGTNKPRFDYILATPTTEPITSEQAQALLSLKTYDEATSISATGDIEPSLDLEYSKDRNTALALTGHNLAHKNALKLNDINTALIELGGN